MDHGADWIVRRDFPASADGYDRETVDAHLERIAARVRDQVEPSASHGELSGAGRLLLEQISSLHVEIDRLSAALRDRSATIAQALDQVLALGPAPAEGAVAPAVGDPDAALVEQPSRAAEAADARLVALDMALGGSSRAEIEHELSARFSVSDPAALTAEVLAAIG